MRRNKASVSIEKVIVVECEGTSMRPLLPRKCRVKVVREEAANLRIGDVALFRRGKKLAAHRVVAAAKSEGKATIVERGDNALNYAIRDGREVVGKVVAVDYGNGFTPLCKIVSRCLSGDSPLRFAPYFSSGASLWAMETALRAAGAIARALRGRL